MLLAFQVLAKWFWRGGSAVKLFLRFVLLGCLISVVPPLRMSAAEFPAITPEEKALSSVPQQPDAPAVVLYREEITDDTKNFRTVYVRLKILTPAGLKYAEVDIPSEPNPFTISQLSGRTVHDDGSIVSLEDQAVDKIITTDHGVRERVKTFTLPAVKVGSILDYRYSLHFPEESRNAPLWEIGRAHV